MQFVAAGWSRCQCRFAFYCSPRADHEDSETPAKYYQRHEQRDTTRGHRGRLPGGAPRCVSLLSRRLIYGANSAHGYTPPGRIPRADPATSEPTCALPPHPLGLPREAEYSEIPRVYARSIRGESPLRAGDSFPFSFRSNPVKFEYLPRKGREGGRDGKGKAGGGGEQWLIQSSRIVVACSNV